MDLTGFKIPEEEADAIYLTPEEIEKLLQLDLTDQPYLKNHRDLLEQAGQRIWQIWQQRGEIIPKQNYINDKAPVLK